MLRRGWIWIVFVVLSLNSGCAVLTKSQVKEVNKFAAAAKEYGEMPGVVIAEHARIRKVRQLLIASTQFNGDSALNMIEIALLQRDELIKKSREADAALTVLKDYAELLVKLSSDDFSTELQSSAESLGKNLDKGIAKYNHIKGANLTLFGSGVAAIVRGIGGVYIRVEQEKALKEAISSADLVIKALTDTVEETMAFYLDNEQISKIKDLQIVNGHPDLTPGSVLAAERTALTDAYKSVAGRYEGKQPPCLPLTVASEMDSADNAALLAGSALKAADSYRRAHTRLVGMVTMKQELSVVIEEIQSLADEVKSAQALKKKLDTK